MFTVIIPPHVEEQLKRLHPLLKSKIRYALDELAKNPFQGKPLKEDLADLFSYRVARFRIIYSVHRRLLQIHVVAIGKRQTIYTETLA